MGFKVQVNLPGPRNGSKKIQLIESVGTMMISVECWDLIGHLKESILFPNQDWGSLVGRCSLGMILL